MKTVLTSIALALLFLAVDAYGSGEESSADARTNEASVRPPIEAPREAKEVIRAKYASSVKSVGEFLLGRVA